MPKQNKDAAERSKYFLNAFLIVFFIYASYIIEISPVYTTRTTVYLLMILAVIGIFVKINFTAIKEFKNNMTFKQQPSKETDEIRDFVE